MKQVNLISSVILASVVSSMPGNVIAQQKKKEKPNVIFVLTDQWRKQALGFKGEDPVQTPHLDEFASWAVSFDNATSCRPVSGPAEPVYLLESILSTMGSLRIKYRWLRMKSRWDGFSKLPVMQLLI